MEKHRATKHSLIGFCFIIIVFKFRLSLFYQEFCTGLLVPVDILLYTDSQRVSDRSRPIISLYTKIQQQKKLFNLSRKICSKYTSDFIGRIN